MISLFDILSLFCGLALFLYGMDLMGNSLKKSAGSRLKMILGKMTSNPVKGFLLGLIVTAVIQSSSATTVMVVGFVNSGIMTLKQAVGVIMGSNIGTTVTAWILSLSGLEGDSFLIKFFKPSTLAPLIGIFGILLYMGKSEKKRGIGTIMLGFRAGRCRAAQLASIRQMSWQVSRGSPIEYQAHEQAGVAWLSWQVSGR